MRWHGQSYYRPSRFGRPLIPKTEWDAQLAEEFKEKPHSAVGDSIRLHGMTPTSVEPDYQVSAEIAAQCRLELLQGERNGWRL